MLDADVTQVRLQCSGIVTVIGELEAASMTKHVGVRLEAEPSRFTSPLNHSSKARSGEGCSSFACEDER